MEVLLVLPNKTIRCLPKGADALQVETNDQTATVTEGEAVYKAGIETDSSFGMERKALAFSKLPQTLAELPLETLIASLALKYDKEANRYPLYVKVMADELDLIAILTRMGFVPFWGEWKGHTAAQSEAQWEEITEKLREKYPDGFTA
jgi:hypothetical protein